MPVVLAALLGLATSVQPVFNCSFTAYRPDCNCSGQHPPFAAPKTKVPLLEDYHYPPNEAADRAAMEAAMPGLVSATMSSASISVHGRTISLTVGQSVEGWRLVDASSAPSAVLERNYDEWGAFVYLKPSVVRVIRKPVGTLSSIKQPRYSFEDVDTDYKCKQDIDPTDFLTKAAKDISDGEEVTLRASISVMEPNPDSALIGNPEEMNKFSLDHSGQVVAWNWSPNNTHGGESTKVWAVDGYLPPGCAPQDMPLRVFPNIKMGMVGKYLRVANSGMWNATSATTGCGVEVTAVAAGATAANATSVVLLRVSALDTRRNVTAAPTVTYVKITVDQNTSALLKSEKLQNGAELFAAIEAQDKRWTDGFAAGGAVPTLPTEDQRYADTAIALLTMYQNLDRNLIPQYGGGKFWNDYNIYLPLDTMALTGALTEWGQTKVSQEYLRYFLTTKVNATTGAILYNIFGCDSDADYPRIISTFARTVEYGGDIEWAKPLMPVVHQMTKWFLSKRTAAVAAFPAGHPLHGIVAGSPEHDICRAPGFFFSVNVWYVRGLLDLARLHKEFPTLSINATWEATLEGVSDAWRGDIDFAANYTAVRKAGTDEVHFLHPLVGSTPGTQAGTTYPLKEGGEETDCIQRGTCFTSMTAPDAEGKSVQITNYANFRIFSETLLAGVLEAKYEKAIMSYREAHRGTLLGMTRFRDVLDDMPILGYGRADIRHDRLSSFHAMLAGHTLNYLTRGTHWGTEQREQIDWTPTASAAGRYRNDCGTGGEYCSLCMVSSVSSSYWIRWMMVTASDDLPHIYVAPGAPRRWYLPSTNTSFGIQKAPTRLGSVSYSLAARESAPLGGWVALEPNFPGGKVTTSFVSVHLRSPDATKPLSIVRVVNGEATLISWFPGNETALFSVGGATNFSFTASW